MKCTKLHTTPFEGYTNIQLNAFQIHAKVKKNVTIEMAVIMKFLIIVYELYPRKQSSTSKYTSMYMTYLK